MAIALPILQFARHFLPFQGGASSIVKEIVLLAAGSGADLAERPHPSHFVRKEDWDGGPNARGAGAQSHLRRELREIVDAELLFDIRNLIDHLFEPVVAKEFVFFFLEIFA
jgi:hypothetical protein